jgi:predicted SprT family Zn-dependent metalloprotease
MLSKNQEQVAVRCSEMQLMVESLYDLQLMVEIDFKLKGTDVAHAKRAVNQVLSISFNDNFVCKDDCLPIILKDIVPHEFAHIVCFMLDNYAGHGKLWSNRCVQLGGQAVINLFDGHTEIVYARGKTYEYTTTRGLKSRISQKRHNIIQEGKHGIMDEKVGLIRKGCQFQVVGINGKAISVQLELTV